MRDLLTGLWRPPAPPPRSRLDHSHFSRDMAQPSQTGLIHADPDFDLGTPSLARPDNVQLVCANAAADQAFHALFKWRPGGREPRAATLLARLSLAIGGQVYEHEQALAYEPRQCSLHDGRVCQYGSPGHALKLSIDSPYRRMRLTFRGWMSVAGRPAGSEQPQPAPAAPERAFVKLQCVICTTSLVYDFLGMYDARCVDAQLAAGETRAQLLASHLLHDRHEHSVHAQGECVVQAREGPAQKYEVYTWGFHVREVPSQVRGRRLLANFANGQTMHLLRTERPDGSQLESGYAALDIESTLAPLEQAPGLDWEQLWRGQADLRFQVAAQGKRLQCTLAASAANQAGFRRAHLEDKAGWAWLADDALLDDEAGGDAALIQQAEARRADALAAGSVWREPEAMPAADELVVGLDEPACFSAGLVGAKAASLAQLAHRAAHWSAHVSPGLVLTRHAHDAILAHNREAREASEAVERGLAEGKALDELARVECARAQAALEAPGELPAPVRDQLRRQLERLFPEGAGAAFAVRSSSWGEDEDDMSAAGQLTTLLDVSGLEAIERAVLSCIASKFAPSNVEYKRQRGLSPALPVAVVVQRMVACDKAGVAFTCDPATADPELVLITANYGLGESVVSGRAEPDTVRVRAAGGLRVEQTLVGSKRLVVRSGAPAAQQAEASRECCLSEAEALQVAGCALAVAHYLGAEQGPRDVEWGLAGGRLFLFQARPVTGLDAWSAFEVEHEADRKSRAELEFMTRANIGEVMPFACTPFTLTFNIGQKSIWYCRMLARMEPAVEHSPLVTHDLLFVSYHAAFGLRCNPLLTGSEGASADEASTPLLIRAAQIGIFGHVLGPQPELAAASLHLSPLVSSDPQQFAGWGRLSFSLRWLPIRTALRQKRAMARLRDDVRNWRLVEPAPLQPANRHLLAPANKDTEPRWRMLALYTQCMVLLRHGLQCWQNHIVTIFVSNARNLELVTLLAKYVPEPSDQFKAMAQFLALGRDQVISAQIPARVAHLAQLVRALPEQQAQRFASLEPVEQAVAELEAGAFGERLRAEFGAFVADFGHRSYHEFEAAGQSWRENRNYLVQMMRLNLRTQSGPAATKAAATNGQLIEQLGLAKCMSLWDRLRLEHLVAPGSQIMVATREHTKNILIEFYDIVRECTRMLALEMRRQLRLPDPDLFYYLFLDELEPLLLAPRPQLVARAARRRQMFNTRLSSAHGGWHFDEIIRGHRLLPSHGQDREARLERLLAAGAHGCHQLRGTPASSGRATARACVVRDFTQIGLVQPGDILVTHSTDIAFSPVFPLVVGLVTEVGGLISHAMVVAREYGLPAVLGVTDATSLIRHGEQILLDADAGLVHRLADLEAGQQPEESPQQPPPEHEAQLGRPVQPVPVQA